MPVPNDTFDAMIRAPMPDSTRRALLMAIRMTTGYRRDEYLMSVPQVAKRMGMHRTALNRALRDLEGRGVVALERIGNKVLMTIKDSAFTRRWDGSNPATIEEGKGPDCSNPATDCSSTATNGSNPATIPYKRKIHTNLQKNPNKQTTAQHMLDIFNEITGKRITMNPRIEAEITARVAEGFTEADFTRAVKATNATWAHSPEMSRNLLPATVYGKRMSEYCYMVSDAELDNQEYWAEDGEDDEEEDV